MTAQPWPAADASVLAPVPEHDDLRKVMRDILESHAGHDDVRRSADSPDGYSPELWRLLNEEMNVGSLAVPEDRGGLGFGFADLAVVLEEAGRALLPEPLLVSSVLGVRALLNAPPGSIPDGLLDEVMAGRLVVTVATRSQDRAVLGATADLVVVRVADTLQLVDLRDGDRVRRTALETLDPTRRLARLDLASAVAYVIAGRAEVDAVTAELDTLARVALAAEHAGMIEAMLEMTRVYLNQREQFGRPLASFQVIKHRLADILVDLERARSAARYAAAAFDQDPATADLPSAVAGATCTEAVIRVAHETVQLHGGIGFTWEHPAHYYLRRALGDEAVFGSAREHRALIADLLGLG